jgi:hypothetical protein
VTVVIAHTGWQVTSIDPSAYVVDAKGDPIYGARVRFTTGAGNQGSVWVPEGALTPANTAELINVQAALLDQIAALGSDPIGQVG